MSDDELVDLGLGPYLHLEPSRRLPVYTRGNAGEVWPQVAYPLSVSISHDVGFRAYRAAALESGLFTEDDLVDGPASFGGCFGGYMYLNLSFARLAAIRMPGTSVEENDATFMGSEGVAPPHVPRPDDKNRRASLRGLGYVLRTLFTKSVPEIDADRAYVTRRLSSLGAPEALSDAELAHRFDSLLEDFGELFARHLVISGKAGAMVATLAGFCEDRLGDRSLALTMLGGLGEVDSATPSFELWELGRMVAADPLLDELFDAGVDGLWARLRAEADAGSFVEACEQFLRRHGARGPNEWESACDTWGTNPDLALALVDRMRGAEPRQAPAHRSAQLAAGRQEALAEARSQLRIPARWLFDRLVVAAAMYTQARERTKTTVIQAIHAIRVSNRELGRRLAERSGGRPDDLYFVLRDELDAFIADPGAFTEAIAQRRATRDALAERVPPFTFDAVMPPADTWPLREDTTDGERAGVPLEVGEAMLGVAGCPGVAEGRARVVLDPAHPGALGPGDVLVAPLTDPAWTPLFVPAEAVVVDVGGQMSHAVIVSRELGLPCVVAATGATARIPDGALIRVDGAAGSVTVLELP